MSLCPCMHWVKRKHPQTGSKAPAQQSQDGLCAPGPSGFPLTHQMYRSPDPQSPQNLDRLQFVRWMLWEAEEIQVISVTASWTGAIYAPRPEYPTPGDCPSPSLPPWSYTGPQGGWDRAQGRVSATYLQHIAKAPQSLTGIYIYISCGTQTFKYPQEDFIFIGHKH